MPSIARGTDGSNPSPSSGESRANLTSGAPLSSAAAPQLSFSKQLGRASESSARLVWSLESGRRRFGHCDAMPKAKARGDIIGTSSSMPGHVIVGRRATRRHVPTKSTACATGEPTRGGHALTRYYRVWMRRTECRGSMSRPSGGSSPIRSLKRRVATAAQS
jgi:hypothetical protein